MCYPTDYTPIELRALLADAIATARYTRDSLDDALHAMLNTPSPTPARPSRDARPNVSPASAGVDEPISETHDER